MTAVGTHPAQWSPQLIERLSTLLPELGVSAVFDPFAGTGTRLGALCDKLELPFAGGDIELWPGRDLRVICADATTCRPYAGYAVVTSPTYGNGLNDNFEPRDDSRRLTYRIRLGRPLHERNTGRYGIRGGHKSWDCYWMLHQEAVALWGNAPAVVVNVKDFPHLGQLEPLGAWWLFLLDEVLPGWEWTRELVATPGVRGHNGGGEGRGEWLIYGRPT